MSHQLQQMDEDQRRMLAVRNDDRSAFENLYLRHHLAVARFFHGMARNPATVADLTQETFLRIWQIRGRYAASGPFISYLFAIARLIWLEHLRQAKKEGRCRLEHVQIELSNMLRLAATNAPDVSAAFSESQERIFAALAELPDEQRMAFVLRTVHGLSPEEVASVMQCPLNTVRSRRIAAVKKLREALGPAYPEFDAR